MGILKTITEEYFGETVRKEDEIDLTGLDVEIVSFTDNNGNIHRRGYKPKDKDNLKQLIARMVEVRGDDGDFNDIDTSDIEDMSFLFVDSIIYPFKRNKTFNGDITGWDVSKVMIMESMFYSAKSFNQPIGKWDVSSVENMNCMFYYAESFNQPIGNWDVSNVENMYGMFYNAISFNQPIGDWKFPKVKDIGDMFHGAENFNQPIGNWDISGVIKMNRMFYDANSFNQDLSTWDLTEKETIDFFARCPIKDEYEPKMKIKLI